MAKNEVPPIDGDEKNKNENNQEGPNDSENIEDKENGTENKIEGQLDDLENNTKALEEELKGVDEKDFEEDKDLKESIGDKLQRVGVIAGLLFISSAAGLIRDLATGQSPTKSLVLVGLTTIFATISYFRHTKKEKERAAKEKRRAHEND